MLRILSLIFAGAAICTSSGTAAAQQWSLLGTAPQGWELYATSPSYESGVDKTAVYNGFPSAFVKSTEAHAAGNSALTQTISAREYAGKRARLSAFVKTHDVENGAGLWMRVDVGSREAVALDNMHDRPLKGTQDWRNVEVVLDVPADATKILFGIGLSGPGTVWLNSCKFETVGKDVPTTGKPQMNSAPVNLTFER